MPHNRHRLVQKTLNLESLQAIARTRLLPLRTSLKVVSYTRLFGACRYRQRISRLALQSRLPSMSGNLMDMGMEIANLRADEQDMHPEVRATPKFGSGCDSVLTRAELVNYMVTWINHIKLWRPSCAGSMTTPRCVHVLRRQLGQGHRVFPLFLMLADQQKQSHTWSVIVHYDDVGTSIVAIDWLNTWNHTWERINEMAMTLMSICLSLVPNCEPRQRPADIMMRIRLPLTGEFNLQDGEQPGYCQSWDSYMVYNILVRGTEPCKLFGRLNRLPEKKRQQRVVNFTNSLCRVFENKILQHFRSHCGALTLPI